MKTRVKLGREAMAQIGRELRLAYDDIIAEGVPEHFAAILRRLDEPSSEPPKRPIGTVTPTAGP